MTATPNNSPAAFGRRAAQNAAAIVAVSSEQRKATDSSAVAHALRDEQVSLHDVRIHTEGLLTRREAGKGYVKPYGVAL